jgi:DeoR/GlpR family transcriptional regulator of sugar metabolism
VKVVLEPFNPTDAMKPIRREKRSVKSSRTESMMGMDDRHKRIFDLLKTEGQIRVEDLAARLKISQVTTRKDLDTLESRGLIERIHGSAIISQQSSYNVAFLEKFQMNTFAKKRIAEAALRYIKEGDSIILDAGTTTFSLAQALPGRFKSLFVITNSVPAALELAKAGYEILLVGGQVRNHSLALMGPAAVKTLEYYHADRAFIGASGITLSHGCSTPYALDAEIKEAMIRATDETYVLCDSSKFGHNCLVSFARLSAIQLLLTDSGISPKILEELARQGIEPELVEVSAGSCI